MEPTGRRRWWAIVAAASMVTSGLAMGPVMAAPAPDGPSPGSKIDAQVTEELEAEGRTDVWVRFDERPDMTQFNGIADWNARGQAVVDALKSAADNSQAEMRDRLTDDGVEYQAFWATNSIRVSGADSDLVTSMAAESGVEGIYPTVVITPPELEPGEANMAPNAVEWGVADINAPEVWDDIGVNGDGIVVASIDTGVQWDHPALINQYRGYSADGSVDHNYNWFDAAGTSPDEPYDGNGHGSHVTGTMVGDDGGQNQIGVAPGAKWIAANGCCPSDAALVASGEWMLEPLDLNGENPDVSKRPHIINNSWGTQVPSNDPFMEDVIEAWAASGQFGVFALGNIGPGCNTAGSPGSRTVVYSVGNYTSNHTIATTSSRGPGQDGEIKPNIAAPGTSVRSSVPGNGYANYSGTSMASPHVAGAVALAWSAAPALAGDVAGTRDLLNGSAIDTEDLQCGGTAENNNVFGEGRLDALGLVEASPVGDTGRLEGIVTDASDDTPIAGAQVEVVGPMERVTTTNSEGAYAMLLTSGTYEMTVSAFGFMPHTQTVEVPTDETVTVNVALEPAASGTVTGTVTDGSGYGFPLYARVVVVGTPLATYTDPETGEYSLDLPEGSTYTLRYEVQYPGYTTPTREVTADGDQTVDVAVPVDANTCTAPGYEFVVDGVTETFDEPTVPEGWTVEDYLGNGQVWAFDDPGGRGNLTGGEGGFAISDSDEWGSGNSQDTGLISPSVDMSDLTNPVVGFKQDWRALGDNADVEVSIDGGETWTPVLQQTTSLRGPREDVVPLPMAAGQSDVRVQFHHYNATWDYWWQIDDVFLGNRACAPAAEGGYVVGTVTGGDTGEGVVGATVTNLNHEEETATTVATPGDPNLDDGFYWIFSSHPGTHPFEAEARNYASQVQDVTVEHANTVRADFVLGSGNIIIEPGEIDVTQPPDAVREHTLTVTNTGSGDAEVELSETGGDYTPLGGVDYAEPTTLDVPTSLEYGGEAMAEAAEAGTQPAAPPWVYLEDYPRVVMDNRVVNLDGEWYTIGGTTGTAAFADVNRLAGPAGTWEAVAPLPVAASAVTAGTVDGEIVVSGGWVDGGVGTDTFVYDAGADTWTQGADAPAAVSAAGTAVLDGKLYSIGGCTTINCEPMSNDVMAYDPGADSWETLADYPQGVAFAACGAVDGEIVCTGGNPGTGGVATSHVYDPGADSWSPLPDAPVDSWASNAAAANDHLVVNGGVIGGSVSNQTFAWSGADQAWVELPPSGTAVYRGDAACGIVKVGGSTGGFTPIADVEHLPDWDDCGAAVDVPWLTVDPMTFTVPAGESVEVDVTTDSTGLEEGVYTAAIRVRTDTPQSIDAIPVTMRVVRDPLVVERWAGTNRYETAAAISSTFEPGVAVAFVATGQAFPDALTGSARAGSLESPVLLSQTNLLPVATRAELVRLEPQRVVVLGGPTAISEAVREEIALLTGVPTDRLSGTDRYGTAAAVASEFDGGGRVFVATGLDYPDALSASARAGAVDSPVLLVRKTSIPRATAEALSELAPSEITVLGGEGAVADGVSEQLEEWAPVTRLGGLDRYQTSAAVAEEYDQTRETVYVASGMNWPDALTGSAKAGSDHQPMLLTRQPALPLIIVEALQRLDPDRAVVLGGPNAVSEDVVEELRGLRERE